MLIASMEFEEVDVSYDLLYLIQNQIIDPSEEYVDLKEKWNLVDMKITNEWRENNFLGFDIVNLYCVRLNVDDWEIFGARSDEEARGYMINKYNYIPKIIKMDKSKWLSSFWMPNSMEYKSLLDLRKENNNFPRTFLII